MAEYVVVHELISGAPTPTGYGAAPNYFRQGETVTDDDLALIPAPFAQVASYTDVWWWNSQTAPPTSNGQVRSNTGDWSSAVATLWITDKTDANLDASGTLAAVKAGSLIVLAQYTDTTRYVEFLTTADAVDSGGIYFTFAVAYQTSQGKVPNSSTQITVSIYPPAPPGSGNGDGGPALVHPKVQRMLDLGAIQ